MIKYFFLELYIRDRAALFWIFVFPTLMYLIFSTIFGGMGKEIDVKVGVLGESRYFDEVLKHLGFEIEVRKFEDLDSMKKAVLSGEVNIGIDLRGFDRSLMSAVLTSGRIKARVRIYHTDDEVSKAAAGMFEGIFSSADLMLMKLMKKAKDIEVVYRESPNVLNPDEFYLGTGIILALLSAGIFGAAFSTSEMKMKKVFKYFEVTPIKGRKVFLTSLYLHVLASVISSLIVIGVGLVKGIEPNALRVLAVVGIGSVTFTSIGTMIAVFIRSHEMIVLVSNLLYFILMFTGGLFFDVSGFIKTVLLVNPAASLASIIRNGFSTWGILVPLIWFVSSSVATIVHLRRGEPLV